MNRETLDTIPTGKDPFAVGQLIPGVTTNTPDVGGTQIMQQPTLQVHGSSNNDNVFMVDNVQIQHIGFGGNQTGFYFNDGLMEEISYQTSSLPAEAPVGGVQINMIPRDGGNQFRGTVFATGGNSEHAEQQLGRRAGRARLHRAEPREEHLRRQRHLRRSDRARPAVVLRHLSPRGRRTTISATRSIRRASRRWTTSASPDGTLRLTWQAARQHKIAVHYDRSAKWRGHRPNNWITREHQRAGVVGRADHRPQLHRPVEVELADLEPAARPSSRCSRCRSITTSQFQQDADPNAIATFDQIRSVFTGVSPRQDINTARMYTYAGFVSYVTGAHNFKTGVQVRTGWSQELFETRGDIVQIVSNGVPQSVRLVNNPSGHKESGVNTGIYVQDSWTLGRVTINPGLRYERFVMSIPAQSAGAGRWVPAREFAAQKNIVNWNTLSPRFGFAWDLFGDGRTAIKGGLSRYDRLAGVTIVQPLNQKNIAFQTCPWADANNDLRAQNDEIALGALHGIAAAEPRLRRSGPEAAASVGIHRHGAAPDRRPHVGDGRLLRPAILGSLHDRQRRRAVDRLHAGDDHQPADQRAADRLQPGSGDARAGAQRAQDHSGSAGSGTTASNSSSTRG